MEMAISATKAQQTIILLFFDIEKGLSFTAALFLMKG